MPSWSKKAARRVHRLLRAALADCRGGAAAEFALIAPAFVFLVFSILEMGLVLYADSALDGAARAAARIVRTGQAQAAESQTTGSGIAGFENALCGQLPSFISCDNVAFDVESFNSFSAINLANFPALATSGQVTHAFSPGAENQAVVVRVSYTYTFITPAVALAQLLSTGSLGNTLTLTSVVVFQNEPFGAV